jgi:hypothetical protein
LFSYQITFIIFKSNFAVDGSSSMSNSVRKHPAWTQRCRSG